MFLVKSRRRIIETGAFVAGIAGFSGLAAQSVSPPNVLIIITDDQGYGDFGFTGNPNVKTPVIDKLASESARFTAFYVSPVSAPTRSSLMTGRYSLRTGVRDTNNGGAVMAAEEVTIAEILKEGAYVTGQFGKWHLGDNYPFRPVDQGFDESLMHLGGGMGQPGDVTTYFRGDSSYFDPVLWHNGKKEAFKGYCSDIFAGQAIKFIEKNKKGPFFCYLAFNAPHTPLQVPAEYYNMYKNSDPSAGLMNDGRPFPQMSENDREDARKVYAMVSNIDYNVGLVLKKLSDLGLARNTIVIFMTDNGPQQRRYVAGMRGLKGSVYHGGVRVPCLIRYPSLFKSGFDINTVAAHIDILPTLVSACGLKIPEKVKTDGTDLWPVISGKKTGMPERSLFFYWTRRSPELYNNIALMRGKYKLVGNTGYNAPISSFELYDLERDPFELKNIVDQFPAVADDMKTELDSRLLELISSENMINKPHVIAGTDKENPVILNRNDADGQWGVWEQEEVFGNWRVHFLPGKYNFRFRFKNPVAANGKMVFEAGSFIGQVKITEGQAEIIEMKNVSMPETTCDFTPFYISGQKKIFPFWVEIEKL